MAGGSCSRRERCPHFKPLVLRCKLGMWKWRRDRRLDRMHGDTPPHCHLGIITLNMLPTPTRYCVVWSAFLAFVVGESEERGGTGAYLTIVPRSIFRGERRGRRRAVPPAIVALEVRVESRVARRQRVRQRWRHFHNLVLGQNVLTRSTSPTSPPTTTACPSNTRTRDNVRKILTAVARGSNIP